MSQNIVSDEDRNKVYELCKNQLGGKWAEVTEGELIIKPVPDGFVNKLFFCFLPKNIETKYNKVVVRYMDYEALKDYLNISHLTAISLMLSEQRISPRMLSIFANGTIIEYIPGRYFNASDDLNNKTVEMLAQKVAKFHSLEMPIPKDWVKETMDDVFNKWFDENLRDSYREGVIREEIEKKKYPVFSKLDFIEEMDWLRKTMEGLHSPIVLSHNDLNRRNILIKQDNDTKELEMFLIDFDWTNYNYRGVDLGQYFAEWRQEVVDFSYVTLPSDQQMCVFIDGYIKEMSKTYGTSYAKQEINSLQQLIKEAKVFALFSFVKDVEYCMYLATTTQDKDILAKGEERFRAYDELKTRILEEYPNL